MSKSRLLLISLSTILLGMTLGCGRWMDYAPIRIKGKIDDPQVAFHRLIRRSQAMGYYVEGVDASRNYFMVRARLDQHKRRSWLKVSYFHVMVHPDGSVDVSVSGFHMRDGGTRIHHKLCGELTMFLDGLSHELHAPPRVVALTEMSES
jgi:hypothetical protein